MLTVICILVGLVGLTLLIKWWDTRGRSAKIFPEGDPRNEIGWKKVGPGKLKRPKRQAKVIQLDEFEEISWHEDQIN